MKDIRSFFGKPGITNKKKSKKVVKKNIGSINDNENDGSSKVDKSKKLANDSNDDAGKGKRKFEKSSSSEKNRFEIDDDDDEVIQKRNRSSRRRAIIESSDEDDEKMDFLTQPEENEKGVKKEEENNECSGVIKEVITESNLEQNEKTISTKRTLKKKTLSKKKDFKTEISPEIFFTQEIKCEIKSNDTAEKVKLEDLSNSDSSVKEEMSFTQETTSKSFENKHVDTPRNVKLEDLSNVEQSRKENNYVDTPKKVKLEETSNIEPSRKEKQDVGTPKNVKLEESSKIEPSRKEKQDSTKKKKSVKKGKIPPMKPNGTSEAIPDTDLSPNCLEGLTFVFTGVLANLNRDDAESFVKILGGRVTKAVSSKTDYLVCGNLLEDGRDCTLGSKYRKASDLGDSIVAILRDEPEFYGLVRMLSDLKVPKERIPLPVIASSPAVELTPPKQISLPAKKNLRNPYRKNPYAKTKKVTSFEPDPSEKLKKKGNYLSNDPNALWADKYAPTCSREIIGHGESLRKLSRWLATWEDTFLVSKKPNFNPKTGPFRTALLSGSPGIGKTTSALLIAKENNRHILEFNASDVRSKKILSQQLGDVTGSNVIQFQPKRNPQKRCVIMDEVDGMGAGDRSGISELIQMIKISKVPIICICNDRQSPKLKTLVSYSLDLRYRRPVKTVIARHVKEIAAKEGMDIEINAAEALSESCGNDIRQVINSLQMWSKSHSNKMTYKDLKNRQHSIQKDDILRLSMFDATRMIVEGSKGPFSNDSKKSLDSFYKRTDAFFTDYSMMGLLVHQNYLKVMISPFQETKRNNDCVSELQILERMSRATETMSDFSLAEDAIRGGNQNWALLPFCAMLAVKVGHHAAGKNGGFLPGYPEFAGWLGKNSSRMKKQRILFELDHHMNFNISTDRKDLRLFYLPLFHQYIMSMFKQAKNASSKEQQHYISNILTFTDEYGLDRDDLFQNIDEFTTPNVNKDVDKFADLDSKLKASFTREYNKGVHKSQALVEEQLKTKSMKRGKSSLKQPADLNVINDDASDLDEDDEDDDTAEILQSFQKKGRKKNKLETDSNSKKRKKSKKSK